MTKQKLLEILLTACMGALIAFLQSFLAGMVDISMPIADPAVAGGIAGLIHTTRKTIVL